MAQRLIILDLAGPPGTWIYAGTAVAVREVQRDLRRKPIQARIAYQALGFSDTELDAAEQFALPAVQDPSVAVQCLAVEIHCACGERRLAVAQPPTMELDPCICGRVWRLPVQVELARTLDGHGGSS